MDLDAGAEDFFAALNSGDADVLGELTLPEPVPETTSVSAGGDPMLVADAKKKKTESSKKMSRNNKEKDKEKETKSHHVAGGVGKTKEFGKGKETHSTEVKGPPVPMEQRVVNLLVPDMKLNDVTLLIRKMKQAGKSDADEFSEADAEQKTAPRFRCDACGNTEQNNFITDYARGDTICKGLDGRGCGNVVQDHIVHEGSAYRKFEGEEDKSHHGPAPNKLFSSSHNLRTLISQDGEMAGNLRRAAEFVEMNLSQMGKDERRTRIGYKDQMKQKACRLIDHTISNLDLHEIVGNRAKKMFAEFRDVREHVHQFEAMVAGCVIAAYQETGKEMLDAQSKIRIATSAGKPPPAPVPTGLGKTIDEKKLFPFVCNKCGIKFNARRALQFHTCQAPPDPNEAANKGTPEPSLKPMVLPEHLKPIVEVKDGKTWYKCPVCSRKYGLEATLEEHMVRHKNQSKKRREHMETSALDSTRLAKTKKLASANPSVQVNTHESVLFRGEGRRAWLQFLQEDQTTT